MTKKLFVLAFLAFTCLSCSNDDDLTPIAPRGDYENGLLITHEGQFTGGFGTVSYVSNDFSTVENNIFSNANGRTLGTVAQSMTFNGDLAYIVINVSNQIEVVNRYTFESVATIAIGLSNPRYMAINNGKGYVTNWGDGLVADDDFIAIIDLENNLVENSVSVGEGPERIISHDDQIIFSLKGGFNYNNKIGVLDISNNTVETITTNDVPDELVIDDTDNLIVLCEGKPAWTEDETLASFVRIDLSNNTIVSSLDFEFGLHPNLMDYDNDNLYYYLNGDVHRIMPMANELSTNPILTGANFYNMRVRNNFIYGVDALDYASNGLLSVYDLNTNAEVFNHTLGIIPGGVYFN